MYTTKELFNLQIDELISYLNKLSKIELPKQVETIDDLQFASRALGKLGPLYSWFVNMEMLANITKKQHKKTNKEKYEEAMMKENIFSSYAKQVNIMYNTVSRMVTIKQQINQELRMLNSAT